MFFIAAAIVCTFRLHISSFETVKIPGVGSVRGIMTPGESRAFLGIPYAKPPTKTLRWRPPVPENPWETTRDATTFGESVFAVVTE